MRAAQPLHAVHCTASMTGPSLSCHLNEVDCRTDLHRKVASAQNPDHLATWNAPRLACILMHMHDAKCTLYVSWAI